ncbi:MAG: L-threonylcarbamoyladenylate synthase [Candidatus Kariarchaeaceae archaeon]|jgi:tRNA threonylcarbamoyl adenosine modification protein (Sua5/YciO/YrdC/YwlC family)
MKRIPLTDINVVELSNELLKGKIMIYPTDTVAGIGCIGHEKSAVDRLFKIKGRDPSKAVSYAFDSFDSIEKYAHITPDTLKLKHLLPGPLTLILPLRQHAPKLYGLSTNTIAVRIPDVPWLLSLITEIDTPIVTTSANRSQQIPSRTIGGLDPILVNQVDILIEWQNHLNNPPSTIVSLIDELTVLREGQIPKEEILKLTYR